MIKREKLRTIKDQYETFVSSVGIIHTWPKNGQYKKTPIDKKVTSLEEAYKEIGITPAEDTECEIELRFNLNSMMPCFPTGMVRVTGTMPNG